VETDWDQDRRLGHRPSFIGTYFQSWVQCTRPTVLTMTEWMYLRIQTRYACSVRQLECRRRHTTDTVSIVSKASASASCQAFSDVGTRIAVVLAHERRSQVRRYDRRTLHRDWRQSAIGDAPAGGASLTVQQHGRLTRPRDHQIATPVMVEVACRKVVEPTLELIGLNDVLGC
jgi:hypothetical protein